MSKICVGAIAGAFGVRGEVRLKSFCADPEAIGDYKPLYDGDGNKVVLKVSRAVKGGFAARVKGVQYKDEADALRGMQLFVDRSVLPSLPDDEYYYSDLVGLDVYDTGGEKLGRVLLVEDHGAGDILEIAGLALKGNVLVAFTAETVPLVDLSAGRIVVDLPEDA